MCATDRRFSLAALAQQQDPFGMAVPEKGIVGTYYRTVIRDGPQLRHSALWGDDIVDGVAHSDASSAAAEGACSAAAEAQAARMQQQTELLIAVRVYKPRGGAGTRAAQCRSDAPAATPLPTLRGIASLRSHKARPPAAEGITLVTQLSLERLPMLERQCRWVGGCWALLKVWWVLAARSSQRVPPHLPGRWP